MRQKNKKLASFGDTFNHEEWLVRNRWNQLVGFLCSPFPAAYIYPYVRPYSHTWWSTVLLGAFVYVFVQMLANAIKGWTIWMRRRRER